ncbi:hypothetical protein V5799_000054 [Amblyomma americanum]|uniref:Uncharacterized protein n=1 Tax=Amblyomma americanum TaxID=6943 RepID=A0AAQ4D454_AMBAM
MEEADKMNALAALKGITMLVDYTPLHSVSTPDVWAMRHLNRPDNFIDYYASLKVLEARRRFEKPPSLAELLIAESFLTGQTTYSRLLNVIVLPTAMQQPPMMYSTRVPLEFDMGTVGVLLAKEMFQAGLPSARSGKNWYETNVNRFVECVQRAFMGNARMSLRQGLELFSWARAVKVAHTATMQMYDANRTNVDFEDIWTAAQQTFFRRFCLMTCSAVDAGLHSRVQCLVPVLNMLEFGSSFRCNSSEAESLKSCTIFLGY